MTTSVVARNTDYLELLADASKTVRYFGKVFTERKVLHPVKCWRTQSRNVKLPNPVRICKGE